MGTNTKKFNHVLKDLLQLKESILENASHALGDKGVTGRNTPAVICLLYKLHS